MSDPFAAYAVTPAATSKPAAADPFAAYAAPDTPWRPTAATSLVAANRGPSSGDDSGDVGAVDRLVQSPALQGAAHPQTLGDVMGLIFAPTDATRSASGAALRYGATKLPAVTNLIRGGMRAGRQAASTGLGVVGDVLDSNVAGLVTSRAPHLGRLMKGAARALEPGEPSVVSNATWTQKPNPVAVAPSAEAAPVTEAAVPGRGVMSPQRILNDEAIAARRAAMPPPAAPVAAPPPVAAPEAAPGSVLPFRPPTEATAATPGGPARVIAMSPQRTMNEIALAARRAKVTLTPDDFKAATEAVAQGGAPADVVLTIGRPIPVMGIGPATGQALTIAAKAKVTLTAAEVTAGRDLIRHGMAPEQALDAIVKIRALPAAFRNLPNDAEMNAALNVRGSTGSWAQSGRPGPADASAVKDVY